MIQNRLDRSAPTYYTGTQVSIWVKDIWIDECTGIQISANQSMIPVYGYASAFWDMVGRGKCITQGVLEINFRDEGYLWAAIYDAVLRTTKKDQPLRDTPDKITLDKIEYLKSLIGDRASENVPDDNISNAIRSRRDVFASVMQDLANMNIADVNNLASKIQLEQNIKPRESIIYQTYPFTLAGYFGNPEVYGKSTGAYRELKNCYLVGNEMLVGDNDQEIGERYSFISRSHI